MFPAVKEDAEKETTLGKYQSSDADITQVPEYLPTNTKNPRNPDRQPPTDSELPEPSDEYVVATATPAADSTDHTAFSSAETERDDPEILPAEREDKTQEDYGKCGWGAPEAGAEQAPSSRRSSESSPAKRHKTDSEEVADHADVAHSLNEGGQDAGAAGGVLAIGSENEVETGIRGGDGAKSETAGKKEATVLSVLSENTDSYEDVQRRVAEARAMRAAAKATGADATA